MLIRFAAMQADGSRILTFVILWGYISSLLEFYFLHFGNTLPVHRIDSVVSIQLIEILSNPFYQVRCISALHKEGSHQHEMQSMNHLADAETGQLRGSLTQEEAIEVAKMRFNGEPKVASVEYLTTTNGHHEYRESPLPAYAITFEHPSKTTVYVSSELGTVQKFRNSKWRVFDFLWMMHTMDYESRDHIGNWLLRAFSIFGLVTVLSGFALFFISAKWKRRKSINSFPDINIKI